VRFGHERAELDGVKTGHAQNRQSDGQSCCRAARGYELRHLTCGRCAVRCERGPKPWQPRPLRPLCRARRRRRRNPGWNRMGRAGERCGHVIGGRFLWPDRRRERPLLGKGCREGTRVSLSGCASAKKGRCPSGYRRAEGAAAALIADCRWRPPLARNARRGRDF
jgi:hypothetical protein